MRTRGKRRRLTARAIKRKWSRYLQQFNGLVDGMYPRSDGMWVPGEMVPVSLYFKDEMIQRVRYHQISTEWRPMHKHQLQPHRYNKKHIDASPDHWPGRRHNMDWDAPRASEWDGWDEPCCTLGSKWSERCTCDECAYMDYLSFDPFDDTDMISEYLLWDDIAVDSDEQPSDDTPLYWDDITVDSD